MKPLNAAEQEFIAKRTRMVRAWRYGGPLTLLLTLGLPPLLWLQSPLLVAPWEVVRRITTGELERGTLELMAVLLPVVVLALCGVLLVMLLYLHLALTNEQRLLGIIAHLRGTAPGPDPVD